MQRRKVFLCLGENKFTRENVRCSSWSSARLTPGNHPRLDDDSGFKLWLLKQVCMSTGLAPASRPDGHSTSEALTPTTPTSSSHNRLGGAPSVNIISGLASGPGMDHMKPGGLAGLLGPPPKATRGRKKIKAENATGPLLVVPYPILADQGSITIAPKEGKTYRLGRKHKLFLSLVLCFAALVLFLKC